jgi:Family of unknown function (DUF5681)
MMAAIFGLPLSEDEAALYRSCTGRQALPVTPFQFVWLCIGRRGGKSFAMAVLAVYLGLFKNWKRFLSPGERATVLYIAADVPQAKILFRYIVGLLKPKLLAAEIDHITASEVELKNGVVIEVCACSYRSVRGRSIAVALLDEVAFWPREDSANPDTDVFNAVRAAQATFGREAMVIASSSPYSRSGILYEAFKNFHGREDVNNIFWRAETRVMNPSVEQSFVDRNGPGCYSTTLYRGGHQMTGPENAGAKQGGRFQKGRSGNPAGKPKGARHRATLAAEALLDGEAEELTRKAVERALAGAARSIEPLRATCNAFYAAPPCSRPRGLRPIG